MSKDRVVGSERSSARGEGLSDSQGNGRFQMASVVVELVVVVVMRGEGMGGELNLRVGWPSEVRT